MSMSDKTSASGSSTDVGPIRIGQREVKSCNFCYKRKVKCDKVFPCSRCKQRGIGELCEQQTVIVNGRLTGGGFPSSGRKPPTLKELTVENKELHRRIAAQEKVIQNLLASGDRGSYGPGGGVDAPGPSGTVLNEVDEQSRATTVEPDAVPGLEQPDYLSIVRHLYGSLTGDEEEPKQIFTQASKTTLESLTMLVPIQYTDFLVRYHCNYLHWIHTVFHIPSFLAEHDEWIRGLRAGTGGAKSYPFLSLYFAIISCSLYFLGDAAPAELGITPEAIAMLPRLWFDVSINCLHLSEFMVRPGLQVLQTICVLPMVAHSFGASAYLFSLLHCGLGLAEDLKYHILVDGSSLAASMTPIHFELGKRIWSCLNIAHCMNPRSHEPFPLVLPPARSSPPANVDDVDLSDVFPVCPRPLEHTTDVSHLITMGYFAEFFRDCNTDTNRGLPLSVRFRRAKEFDKRLGELLDRHPDHKPIPGEVFAEPGDLSAKLDYRPWSRFLYATLLPHSRIYLFRWFLRAAYSDSRYAEARTICLAAAREMTAIRRSGVPVLHVSSHTFMAALVVATELMHGGHDEITNAGFRAEIFEAIEMLASVKSPNAIVPRGVQILQQMLDEAAAQVNPPAPAPGQDMLFTWDMGEIDQDYYSFLFQGSI
ncbi:hypothetical protein IAT38_006427 [Cryptococcus sp. DSM 104549]